MERRPSQPALARGCLGVVLATACAPAAAPPAAPPAAPTPPSRFPLVAVRAALHTQLLGERDPTPPPTPPPGVFVVTHYQRGADALVAYETPVVAGARRPAIVWIAGGFDWGIGDGAWTPGPPANDQSAATLRPPGIVLMRPALRGASGNPGRPECFLGEVDDILAAADHLAQRPDVDPTRIYLGGHSTGGTLALLAAASTARFRAVFAFGPIDDPRDYGPGGCLPSDASKAEVLPRAPMAWTSQIVTPTFVIEGVSGNAAAFPALARSASRAVTFVLVPGADHFDVLQPGSRHVAKAILADTGPDPAIHLDADAIAADVAR